MSAQEMRVIEIVSDLLGVRREDVFVDSAFADDLGSGFPRYGETDAGAGGRVRLRDTG